MNTAKWFENVGQMPRPLMGLGGANHGMPLKPTYLPFLGNYGGGDMGLHDKI